MPFASKITIVGPESTGKSTLCQALATHYNAPFVAEYARTFLEEKNTKVYQLSDLETIAKTQVAITQKVWSKHPPLLFCDTDLVTLHIWALDKFNQAIPFVEAHLQAEKADLYLLCKPDIAWQPDPLREDAHRREALFFWNAEVLQAINAEYEVVSGSGKDRLAHAIHFVDNFLAHNNC